MPSLPVLQGLVLAGFLQVRLACLCNQALRVAAGGPTWSGLDAEHQCGFAATFLPVYTKALTACLWNTPPKTLSLMNDAPEWCDGVGRTLLLQAMKGS